MGNLCVDVAQPPLAVMGRMHSKGKGISKSALPYRRTPPSWLKVNPGEGTEHVCKLAREDLYCLIKKAVSVRKHLDKFRQDKDAKFRLILIESRIHRIPATTNSPKPCRPPSSTSPPPPPRWSHRYLMPDIMQI